MILIGATTENPSLRGERRAALALPRGGAEAARPRAARGRAAARARTTPSAGWRRCGPEVADDALALPGRSRGRRRAHRAERARAGRHDRGARAKTAAAAWTCRPCSEAFARKSLLYDRAGEEHFNIISALHKSVRNSDADAGLYWLARMLEAGEDPLYVARRLVRFASEDVGLADPQALVLAMAAQQAVHFIGMPEGALALAQAVVYLAAAPKSNALYRAYGAGGRRRAGHARRAGAALDPQRAHAADEGPRLRQGLPLRARRGGGRGGDGLPARQPARAAATTSPPTAGPEARTGERLEAARAVARDAGGRGGSGPDGIVPRARRRGPEADPRRRRRPQRRSPRCARSSPRRATRSRPPQTARRRLELLDAQSFDLAILDVAMPGDLRLRPLPADPPGPEAAAHARHLPDREGPAHGHGARARTPAATSTWSSRCWPRKLVNMVGMFLSPQAPLRSRRKTPRA